MPPTKSALESLGDRDLYALFEIPEESTKEQVTKAYRKKALKVHPDKNPDNPKAAEMFHLLTQALEVLGDVAARAAYDRCRKAKKATQERNSHLDARRKKLKEELEAREYSSKSPFSSSSAGPAFAKGKPSPAPPPPDTAMSQFEREVLRLRKEGSRLVEEEQERLRQELKDQMKAQRLVQLDARRGQNDCATTTKSVHGPRLKLRWSAAKGDASNGGVTQTSLTQLFSQYGKLNFVLISQKKPGSAIIEFTSVASADAALRAEQKNGNFEMEWILCESGPTSQTPSPPRVPEKTARPAAATLPTASLSHADFEAKVLARIAAAAKRKQMDLSA